MKHTFGIGLFFITFFAILFFSWYQPENSDEFENQQGQIAQEEKFASAVPTSEAAVVNNDIYVTAAQEKETVSQVAEKSGTRKQKYIALEETSGYITIFYDTREKIFTQTDICKSDLPDNLQQKLKQGIVFENLESVFEFLENYSS